MTEIEIRKIVQEELSKMFKSKLLSKTEFLEYANISSRTYQKRMVIMKNLPEFSDGYVQYSNNEVYINIEIYDRFKVYYANHKAEIEHRLQKMGVEIK